MTVKPTTVREEPLILSTKVKMKMKMKMNLKMNLNLNLSQDPRSGCTCTVQRLASLSENPRARNSLTIGLQVRVGNG